MNHEPCKGSLCVTMAKICPTLAKLILEDKQSDLDCYLFQCDLDEEKRACSDAIVFAAANGKLRSMMAVWGNCETEDLLRAQKVAKTSKISKLIGRQVKEKMLHESIMKLAGSFRSGPESDKLI